MHLKCYASILKYMGDITEENYPIFQNISVMYNYVAPHSDAIALQQRKYEFACQRYGEYSEQTMLIVHDIGWKHSNAYYYEDALLYSIKAAHYFISHPNYEIRDTLAAITTCGDLYLRRYERSREQSDYEKSTEYFDHAMKYGEKMVEWVKGHHNPNWHYAAFQYECIARARANRHLLKKEYDKARVEIYKYRDVVCKYKSYLREEYDLNIADWLRYHERFQYEVGNYDEAIDSLEKAYEKYRKFFAMTNPRILEMLEQLALCYLKKEIYPEAEKYLVQAIEIIKDLYVEDHPIAIRLNQMLAEFRQAAHQKN